MKSVLSLACYLALVLREGGKRLFQVWIDAARKVLLDEPESLQQARRLRYRYLLACLGVPGELLDATDKQIPRDGHEPLVCFFQVALAYLDFLRAVERKNRRQDGQARRGRPSPDWGGGEESVHPYSTGDDAEATGNEVDCLAVALMETVQCLVYTTAIACLFHEGAPVNVDGMPMSSRPMHSSGRPLTQQSAGRP